LITPITAMMTISISEKPMMIRRYYCGA